MPSHSQFELDFEPGLLERYPTFLECIQAAVHGCGKPLKLIAADMEMTAPELCRKISGNPNDTTNFPAKLLPDLIRATGSKLPVYWLIEQFLEKPEARQARVLSEAEKILKDLPRLLEALKK